MKEPCSLRRWPSPNMTTQIVLLYSLHEIFTLQSSLWRQMKSRPLALPPQSGIKLQMAAILICRISDFQFLNCSIKLWKLVIGQATHGLVSDDRLSYWFDELLDEKKRYACNLISNLEEIFPFTKMAAISLLRSTNMAAGTSRAIVYLFPFHLLFFLSFFCAFPNFAF